MRHSDKTDRISVVKHWLTTEIRPYCKATVKEYLTVRISVGVISTAEKFSVVQEVFA